MCKTSEALQPRVEKSREEVVMKTFEMKSRMNRTSRCVKAGALLLAITGLCGCAGNANQPASTNHPARRVRRQIILADMHSIEPGRQA